MYCIFNAELKGKCMDFMEWSKMYWGRMKLLVAIVLKRWCFLYIYEEDKKQCVLANTIAMQCNDLKLCFTKWNERLAVAVRC